MNNNLLFDFTVDRKQNLWISKLAVADFMQW
jgi:hypothetical protein